ncbi:MAG: PilZ domain-containing protein [Nitrospiraceae bacterium]
MRDELRSSGSEEKGSMDLRKVPRLRVHFRSFFAGGLIDGEGTVMDLSTKGCKIGSDTRVQPVTELEVWFFLPDQDQPIRVQLAEVRWTREREFGLEFLSMRLEERERLDRVLRDQGIGSRA